MTVPTTRKGIVARFARSPKEIRDYFKHLPKLTEEFPWDVTLSYLFARVEYSHNMMLYCGIVKLHQAQKDIVFSVIQQQHLTRSRFEELFLTVVGEEIDQTVLAKLREAEDIRDKVLHGKSVTAADMRKAITCVIEYAELFNAFVKKIAGLKPFDDLRGFKGAGKSLPKKTTRWIMKGMGFVVS